MFGAWSLYSAWSLFWSSATLGTLIGCGAVAVAVLMPPALAAITDLRKWAIVVAVIAFGYSATFTRGMNHGLAVKQSEWDSALVKETRDGETARTDADRTVGPMPSDRRMLRSDPFNRNSGTEPECK
jgi:hypothetical protein